MKKHLFVIIAMLLPTLLCAQYYSKIGINEKEKWYGGFVALGSKMPYAESDRVFDLAGSNMNNQTSPLLLSSNGRYIWSEQPFKYKIANNVIEIWSDYENIQVNIAGQNLKDAYMAASKRYFPASGKTPDELFFSLPQYNTWIELMYNQNQEDILNYANKVIEHNFKPGIFMIDDNWQKYYGNFDFKPETFSNPKQMCDSLHKMGFKVMLWVCPYVSADSPEFRDLERKGYLLKDKSGATGIVRWWNGYSACYDTTNPEAMSFFAKQLKECQQKYGVDGFKFDGADVEYMLKNGAGYSFYDKNANNNVYMQKWAELGLEFPYNELRACWKLGGKEIVQRLGDKGYSWGAVKALIPEMIGAGLLGYIYTCPDMIGGGNFASFLNVEKFNQELIIRSCQVHALMPMMQFSVAPWRVLDKDGVKICAEMAELHAQMSGYILQQAIQSSKSGEPIVRSMEYQFPHQGFVECKDQFMLGDKYMVAPMVTSGTSREVMVPKGVWKDDLGHKVKGPQTIKIDVPIERLPYYEKVK